MIDNSPSLVDSVMSFVNNNILTFIISGIRNIKYLLVVDIDEVSSSIPEDLPPVGVGAIDSQVLGFTAAFNFK
jgi:hypothetical protein